MQQTADLSVTETFTPTPDQQRLTRIIDQLMERAETLIESLDEPTISAAPLNQRSSALNAVRATLDLLFKVQQQAQAVSEQSHNTPDGSTEQVIRIEYLYPDGSTHPTPPWAARHDKRHPPAEDAVSGRSLWEAFWENADGEDAAH